MKKILPLLAVFMLAHYSGFADGYWLELSGTHRLNDTLLVKIRYGGVNEHFERYINKGALLDKMKDYQLQIIDPKGHPHTVKIVQREDSWTGYFIPTIKGSYRVFAKNDALPVVEREDSLSNIKPVQYLLADYTVGNGAKAPLAVSRLQFEVMQKADSAIVHPLLNGQPLEAGTQLRVFLPDNHDLRIKVGQDGNAILPIRTKGTYMIRQDQLIPETNTYKGKKYYAVRHRCDYILTVN